MKKQNLLVLLILIFLILVTTACAQLFSTKPEDSGRIEVVMRDNKFEPEIIQVTAGQTVQIVLRNEGEKLHEFMIGRDLLVEGDLTEGFAEDLLLALLPQVDGPGMVMGMPEMEMTGMEMEDNDMEGMPAEEHTDEEMPMGDEEMGMDNEEMGMGDAEEHEEEEDADHAEETGGVFGAFQLPAMEVHAGLMVMIDPSMIPPSAETIITLTIPEEMVGTWEFGCFQEQGQHYDDGMRGTLIVAAP